MIPHNQTIASLIEFEEDIARRFNNAEIPYPIHLSGGNEQALINIFEDFKQGDWVFNSWRSHYHALLAGVPPEKVRAAILAGRSMTLCWPEHNFFCSAIVGGVIPIALGVAWQIKRCGGNEKVFLFMGDMTACTGIAHECSNYAMGHDLPLKIVVEDNGKSVCTDTASVWGKESVMWGGDKPFISAEYYRWNLPWPHSGAGKRIQF